MGLARYACRRVLEVIPTVLAIIVLCFVLIHLAPGDPVTLMMGSTGAVDPGMVQMLTKEFGLDKPLWEQLLIYVGNVLRGDFGYSYYYHQRVVEVIMQRAGYTLLLMLTSGTFAILLGILLGVESSRKQRSLTDMFITISSVTGFSVPTFFLGLILLLVFGIYLRWLPIGGSQNLAANLTGLSSIVDLIRHMILPTVTLGVYYVALITRLTRSSMLEVLRLDYITFARSKGVSETRVTYKHALRNALLPVITIIGISMGQMLTGAILTETVFGWPGLGRLLYDSIMALDYLVIMGIFIMSSTAVIAISLIVDICYAFLDPRIKFG